LKKQASFSRNLITLQGKCYSGF